MHAPRATSPRPRRRAFTLIEAVAVIVVLAIAVPPSVSWLDASAARQADSVSVVRATALATGIMEQVLADASSSASGLGLAGVAAANYVTKLPGGLADRLTSMTAPYTTAGFTWTVTVAPAVSKTGAATGDPNQDLFRAVTVTVTAPSASGGTLSLSVASVVSDP